MKIQTYQRFNEFVETFISNKIQFCIVRGDGGEGKSFAVEKALKDSERNHVIFSGKTTTLSIYKKLLSNPNSLVVFDDVDMMLKDKGTVALMKQLCEVKHRKTIRYDSTTHKLNEDEKEFISRNKIMIICNDLSLFSKDLKALKTRAIVVEFLPTNQEMLSLMKNKIVDNEDEKEIVEYIEEHIATQQKINLRMLTKTRQFVNTPMSWKRYLNEAFGVDTEKIKKRNIFNRLEKEEIDKDKARIEYMNKTGQTERNFYRDFEKFIK